MGEWGRTETLNSQVFGISLQPNRCQAIIRGTSRQCRNRKRPNDNYCGRHVGGDWFIGHRLNQKILYVNGMVRQLEFCQSKGLITANPVDDTLTDYEKTLTKPDLIERICSHYETLLERDPKCFFSGCVHGDWVNSAFLHDYRYEFLGYTHFRPTKYHCNVMCLRLLGLSVFITFEAFHDKEVMKAEYLEHIKKLEEIDVMIGFMMNEPIRTTYDSIVPRFLEMIDPYVTNEIERENVQDFIGHIRP